MTTTQSGACTRDATCNNGGTVHCAMYEEYGAVLEDVGDSCCTEGCYLATGLLM